MLYDQKFLEDKFKEISEGKSPEGFLKEKCPELVNSFLQAGKDFYRQTGPYWEVLRPILQKYSPEEYKRMENLAGDLDVVDSIVMGNYNYGSDELNFIAALQYMEMRFETMAEPNQPHLIELNGEEKAYIPNYSLDNEFYNGRE